MKSSLPELSKAAKGVVSILTDLKNKDKKQLINDKEASVLASLKFTNGEPILSLEDRNFVYEIVWLLNEVGYEKTFNFLSADWEKVLGSNNIRKRMLFENPLLDRAREKFILDMDIFKTVQVEAGEKCKKCGSEETMSVVSQNKRADEQQTIQIFCLQCRYKWLAQ